MAVGDQADFVGRIRGALPKRWFPASPQNGPSATPVLDGVLNGLAAAWAFLYSLYTDCVTQGRIATATLVNLDIIALDFFGTRITRAVAQSDTSFRQTIQQEILRPRNTRAALIQALTDLTGQAPQVIEPANPRDTGGYGAGPVSGLGAGPFAYNTGGAYGSLSLPFQCFVTAFLSAPSAQGLSNAAAWGNPQTFNIGAGGYGTTGGIPLVTPTSGGQIVDAAGITYTMNAQTFIVADGVFVPGSSGTGEITVVDGVLWAMNAPSGPWFTLVNGQFTEQSGNPPGTPVSTGTMQWANIAQITPLITNETIEQTVVDNIPAGVVAWLSITP